MASSGFDAIWTSRTQRIDPATASDDQARRLGGAMRIKPSNYTDCSGCSNPARGLMLPRVCHPDECATSSRR